jgi:16S rRNA (guanine966-N2)-methyltransferase
MMLEPWQDARVVDLYAGSGALGIEGLSRGAAFVDFAESARHALIALERNLETLELGDRARVWRVTLPGGLARLQPALAQADIVLLDPPYGGPDARRALDALDRSAILKRGCRVVLEHHAKDDVPSETGALLRSGERRYGETQITFYAPRERSTPGTEE